MFACSQLSGNHWLDELLTYKKEENTKRYVIWYYTYIYIYLYKHLLYYIHANHTSLLYPYPTRYSAICPHSETLKPMLVGGLLSLESRFSKGLLDCYWRTCVDQLANPLGWLLVEILNLWILSFQLVRLQSVGGWILWSNHTWFYSTNWYWWCRHLKSLKRKVSNPIFCGPK